MNLMGDRAHHSILSAMPGALGARDAIAPAIIVDFPKDAPPLHGKPSLGRYRVLANYMTRFDLVLSSNWCEIGSAHVCTSVTIAHLVFLLLLQIKKHNHLTTSNIY